MHKPIFLNHISLSFANKICFEDFSTQIQPQSRIAIIGNNGSGKSSLLKIIMGEVQSTDGEILNNQNIVFGYVPQLIYDYDDLSGGQKFNKALSCAIGQHPDILILDEPTNHLDQKNRKSLIKMLNFYNGTLIIVSHDVELLRNCVGTIWHIDNGTVKIFTGKYDDYRQAIFQKRQSVEDELLGLKKEKKESHKSLMKEQQRASKSKARGEKLVEQKRWLPAVGDAKQSVATKTAGKHNKGIVEKKEFLNSQLSGLRVPEIIKPKFSLNYKDIGDRTIISISGGSAGYEGKEVLHDINLSVSGGQHLAVLGDNGSGKTTLFKAILNDSLVLKSGIWDSPNIEDIGYLDQYYNDLDNEKTVIDTLQDLVPSFTHTQLRDFLNDFLFRKNEEINKQVNVLSGGERARLSLAKIALKTPKLLLIDEITNNIDLETKEHVVQVLSEYAGAMIIISHDVEFLKEIGIDCFYEIHS